MTEAYRLQNVRGREITTSASSNAFLWIVILSAAHMLLGLLLYSRNPLALLHPATVFLVGLYWALNTRFKLERVGFAIAYLVGAEVLWRMAHVPVFWEFGKYGGAALAILALLRRSHVAVPKLPLIYLALLVPGCIISLLRQDMSTARSDLSSIMSGPLLLAACCWYFSALNVRADYLRQLFFFIIVPLCGIAFAASFFTITADDIQFTNESNFRTSGGFGPNQVSAMLGLGAFLSFACLLVFRNSPKYILYLMAVGCFFTAQSVLTFSRGGIYNAVGGLLVISLIELRKPNVFIRRFAPIAIVVTVCFVLIFPFLNDFTGGSLRDRFEDTATTSRTEIAESDFAIFSENPLFGVGVGVSSSYRKKFLDREAPAHTEFSRMVAEHGLFGLLAVVIMLGMAIMNFVRQQSTLGRALVAGCIVWAVLFMSNAGMRLAAPSFICGLTFVSLRLPRSRKYPGVEVTH